LLCFVDARDVDERHRVRCIDSVHVPHVRKPLLAVDGEARAHERQEQQGRQEGVDRSLTDRVAWQKLDGNVVLGEERDDGVLRVPIGDDRHRRGAVLQLEEDALAVDLGFLDVAGRRVGQKLGVADARDVPVRRDMTPDRPSNAGDAD
jgi:hypothetical protein